MAKAELKWVTHAGKHIPIKADSKTSNNSKSDSKATDSTGTSAGGINGKKQLSKMDKLNNLKGPKTKKK